MPFKSDKQRKLCWVLYNKDVQAGRIPKWDCAEWAKETKKASRVTSRKGSRKGSRKTRK